MAEKVKKSLHPAIACALMVIMLCCALLNGAHKAWTKEQNALEQYRAAVLESVQARVETANNLLTVAGRYTGASDPLYAAVQSDLRSMENGKTMTRRHCCSPLPSGRMCRPTGAITCMLPRCCPRRWICA